MLPMLFNCVYPALRHSDAEFERCGCPRQSEDDEESLLNADQPREKRRRSGNPTSRPSSGGSSHGGDIEVVLDGSEPRSEVAAAAFDDGHGNSGSGG